MRISDWSSDVCSSDLNRTWVLQLLWPLSYIPPWSIARYPVGYCGRRRPEACQQLMVPASSIVFAGSKDSCVEIGRAHVCTPVTNAHLVCRLLLAQEKTNNRHQITTSPS